MKSLEYSAALDYLISRFFILFLPLFIILCEFYTRSDEYHDVRSRISVSFVIIDLITEYIILEESTPHI